MAYVTPNSTIHLYKGVKLVEGAEDTLYFGSRSAQESYFSGLTPTWSASDFRFIGDKDIFKIRVSAPYATVKDCNYMRYKNTGYENKWMYCFIKNTFHVSDECTEIEYTIDPLQTWLAGVDYTLKQCRVVRQHQAGSDNIGDNIQPENIQITTHHPLKIQGQYEQHIEPYHNGIYICLMFPEIVEGTGFFYAHNNLSYQRGVAGLDLHTYFPAVQKIDDVPIGNCICVFDPSDAADLAHLVTVAGAFGQHILNSWIIPKDILPNTYIFSGFTLSNNMDPQSGSVNEPVNVMLYCSGFNSNNVPILVGPIVTPHQSFTQFYNTSTMVYNGASYTVKNKKLFTSPYSYYELMGPNGQGDKYYFEDMTAGTNGYGTDHVPTFQTVCSVLSDTFGVVPLGYNFEKYAYDKQVSLPNYPVSALTGANGENIQKSLLPTIMQMGTAIAGMAGGFGASLAASAVGGAAGLALNSITHHAGNSSINNLNNMGLWATFKTRSIRGSQFYPENCKEIDDYFQAYGYTQNKFAVPSINHRTNWTFVQTDGANFTPVSIPSKYLKQINELFDKGIRFHKSAATIGNMDGYTNAISS